MVRQHGADVIIDDHTQLCIKDRAEKRPGRRASAREIAQARINATEDHIWRERKRARIRAILGEKP